MREKMEEHIEATKRRLAESEMSIKKVVADTREEL